MTNPREKTGPNESLREEYVSRINRVIDHIEKNIDRDLSLDILADVACFSRFHFHRIFRAMVGETLNRFIQRVRIEKAAARLINNPKESITEIALDYGFSGSATFARAFRETFRMSASEWRSKGIDLQSNHRKIDGKNGQPFDKNRKDAVVSSYYIDPQTDKLLWRVTMNENKAVQVEVKDMPEFHVAYIRHIGPYKGDSELFGGLFDRLMKWAGPRDLLRFPGTQGMSVYHDDPKVTDEDKLRTSVCITVPEGTPVDGEVGKMTVPGGKFAVARFELAGSDEYEKAWNVVFRDWLPESGYQPDDRPCVEIYHNDPNTHPQGLHIVDICLPVKPL